MFSHGSGSDSDSSSDSDTEKLAHLAFKQMKTKLLQQKKCKNASSPNPEANQCSNANGRRKLYDTFVSNSDDESTAGSTLCSQNDKHVSECTNSLFFIDTNSVHLGHETATNYESLEKNDTAARKDQTEIEVTDLSNLNFDEGQNSEDVQPILEQDTLSKTKTPKRAGRLEDLSTALKSGVNCKDIYVNVNPYKNPKKQTKITTGKKPKEPEIMKKCVIADDFEKQDTISPIESQRQKHKQRKLEREKTKGEKWFHMAAPEITEERKHDLEVLQMRKALDPKRFYKSSDTKVAPKYFQFGQVVEAPADFYSSRIPKKQRKSTMVEELLADAEFRRYNKRKYEEIQEMKRLGKGPYQRMKRLRKKKKAK